MTESLDDLLLARGQTTLFGAHIVSAAWSGATAAFALGDGTVRIGQAAHAVHAGAILCLAADSTGFVTGGDDGALRHTTPDGAVTDIAAFGSRWVEQVATFPAGKAPYLAAAVGKNLHLFTAKGEKIREFAHPTTVTGIAFDAKGKRVAASHYNGASLWFTASNAEKPTSFAWKGSHIGVALHPAGEAIVTAMQENALHGWTIPEQKHMRMAGYPAKTESFGFTKSGRWLATAGAESLVLWPFFGGGPTGKAPLELGASEGIIKRIACHPQHEIVAVGFDTGLVLMIDVAQEKILPVCGPGRGAVSAMAWNAAGSHLAFGTETGFSAILDLAAG
jgi:WD40 repeat protein